MRPYTLALAANTPMPVHSGGEYFLLETAPLGGVKVEFFGASGVRRDQVIEDGEESTYAQVREGFTSLKLTSTLAQTVKFYIARDGMGRNVFSGSSDVTDRAARLLGVASLDSATMDRVLFGDDGVNEAFVGYGSLGAVAGNVHEFQVWNPVGSGKVGYVDKISPQPGAATLFAVRVHNAALPVLGTVFAKVRGGGAGGLEFRTRTAAAPVGTQLLVVANVNMGQLGFRPPFRLPEGQGVHVSTQTVNVGADVSIEFRER
jgi:hypothetical protein